MSNPDFRLCRDLLRALDRAGPDELIEAMTRGEPAPRKKQGSPQAIALAKAYEKRAQQRAQKGRKP